MTGIAIHVDSSRIKQERTVEERRHGNSSASSLGDLSLRKDVLLPCQLCLERVGRSDRKTTSHSSFGHATLKPRNPA